MTTTNNPYLPTMTTIEKITKLTNDTALFKLKGDMPYKAGQFAMLTIPHVGEAPFSITGDMEFCIRNVGEFTNKLHMAKEGDQIGIRGPFGTDFEIAPEGDIYYIAGGIGIAPLRPMITKRGGTVLLGARNKEALLFPEIATHIRCDNEGKGYLPDLIAEVKIPQTAICLLCGPPAMYKHVIDKLLTLEVKEHNILLSLERHMDCGIGMCGHCRCGGLRICKEGPVFKYSDIKDKEGMI